MDEVIAPAQDTQQSPSPTPNTDLGEKLQQYQQQRFQQQSQQVTPKDPNAPVFANSASKDMDRMSSSVDPNIYGPNTMATGYGAGPNTGNFERYYSHPLYSKLGFQPFDDNEERYNKQATGFQDFVRASKQWGGLAMVGIKSMAPWNNPFSLEPDVKLSNEMASKMAIGASTRPGAVSALTNFATSIAYMAGMMGEMGGEIAATTALTTAEIPSFGTDTPATVAAAAKTVSTGKKIIDGFSAIKDFFTNLKVFEASRATGEA